MIRNSIEDRGNLSRINTQGTFQLKGQKNKHQTFKVRCKNLMISDIRVEYSRQVHNKKQPLRRPNIHEDIKVNMRLLM